MRIKVAIQGEPGAYSEMAALRHFGRAEISYCHSFQEAFTAAEQGSARYAVVPVENSLEGTVNEVYDLLLKEDGLDAVAEVYQRVQHCLVVNPGVRMRDVKSANSHPQALAQCREYLKRHHIEPVAAYDTAGAVKQIKISGSRDAAAIASKRAAEFYSMKILDRGIEDRKPNFTRFLVLQRRTKSIRRRVAAKDGFKTSIIFSVPHAPGALHKILGEFAERGINLTKVESRPTKDKPWEYNFYLDFEGAPRDKAVREAIERIKETVVSLKIIGPYARASFT